MCFKAAENECFTRSCFEGGDVNIALEAGKGCFFDDSGVWDELFDLGLGISQGDWDLFAKEDWDVEDGGGSNQLGGLVNYLLLVADERQKFFLDINDA